jgi:predicted AAA+ superfamily ATPase
MRETLELLNEWWFTGNVAREKAPPYRRKPFGTLWEEMGYRQMLILTGLRRVGKSTLMHQLIEELIRRGEKPARILYFSFDERVEKILDMLREYQKLTGTAWKEERVYLFLDEIHKLPGWSGQIKILYDSLPRAKLVLSGSASILLQREAGADLAGRYFLREIEVLSLREFAELSGKKIDRLELWRGELEALLPSYLKRPFPEIVGWGEGRVKEYTRELVIGKCLREDLPRVFGRVRVGMLNTLLEHFMKSPGNVLNLTALSKDLGVHKLTLQDHLFYLEFAKLLRVVRNFRPSLRAESRKLKKIYPTHIALAFPFAPHLEPDPVYETAVASALGLEHYWRKGYAEIDFVKRNEELLPVEVTCSEEVPREKIGRLLGFMKRYGARRGLLVYGGRERRREEAGGKTVKVVPLLDLLLGFDSP